MHKARAAVWGVKKWLPTKPADIRRPGAGCVSLRRTATLGNQRPPPPYPVGASCGSPRQLFSYPSGRMTWLLVVVLASAVNSVRGAADGLALKPPMGWR